MSRVKLNFIDLFSGAGGMSTGLEMAGHRCVLGVDYDKYATESFAKNHKYAKTYHGDICKLKGKLLKEYLGGNEIHAVVGGPPCQGFSTVGIGDPKDQRNTLFREFLRIVKTVKPQFIVIENVTGLLAKKNEKTLDAIFRLFQKLGFQLDVQVMESQKYGVPEKRRRTIIIGSRINSKITFPKFTHDTNSKPAVTVGEAFKDLKDKKGNVHNHDIDLAEIKNKIDQKRIKRIPEGKGIRYEADEKAYLPKSLKLGVDWKNIRENRFRQTKYLRLNRSLPSPTIMTHRHSYYHPTEDRFLTQREAARIQSFPNDFVFVGPVSAQWRQIGNAVPPLMAKSIGLALRKMYKEAQSEHQSSIKKTKHKEIIKEKRQKAFVY